MRRQVFGKQYDRCPEVCHVIRIMSLLVILFLAATEGQAAVVQDTVYTEGTWNFQRQDCGCPPCIQNCGFEWHDHFDMTFVYIFSPPLGQAIHAYSGAIPLGDVPIDSVRQAPLTGYVLDINAQANEEFQV